MEARFAGSQRVGDRRRRRLAVGADDGIDSPNADGPVRTDDLAAPAGVFRALDLPHTDGPSTVTATSPNLPPLNLPVSAIIPAAGWKYLVGGLLALAVSAGIIVAGHFSSRLQAIVGPGIADLLALPNGRLAQCFSSLLLLLCAQLALFIWWARSRSLEDFEGRYWLWIRTAGVWVVLSGCLSTEAHQVAASALRFIRMGLSQRDANLGWMIPSGTLGIMLVRALAREMRGCRASRALLLAACALQFMTAAVYLELESVLSPATRAILVQSGLLTGHVALFLSMWLHARHVVHFSADPAPGPSRAWRIPRPHFGFSQAKWVQAWQNRGKRNIDSQTPSASPQVERKRPAREPINESTTRQPVENGDSLAATPVERPAKPRIRFDGRHKEPSPQMAPESTAPDQFDAGSEPFGAGAENRAEPEPATVGLRNVLPARTPGPASQSPADASICGAEPADADEASDEEQGDGTSKPELRGLSKKQRRRMMQELRDRERASRQ